MTERPYERPRNSTEALADLIRATRVFIVEAARAEGQEAMEAVLEFLDDDGFALRVTIEVPPLSVTVTGVQKTPPHAERVVFNYDTAPTPEVVH